MFKMQTVTKVFEDTVKLVLLGLLLLFLWFAINHERKTNPGVKMVICTKTRYELQPIT